MDRVIAVLSPPRRLIPEESLRNLRFEREFPLEPGLNEISVVATDNLGLQRAETFRVTRHLRFYETDEFFPSALATALGLVGLGFVAQYARRRRALRMARVADHAAMRANERISAVVDCGGGPGEDVVAGVACG